MNSAAGIAERAEPALKHSRLDTHEFRIEDWLVQPARNRMVRGDTAIRVRPQLIDVLACLAACPGRVVSKDQLLTEVWCDRFVAESGVARCVAELRQLLEDDARRPRIIETISKRGYAHRAGRMAGSVCDRTVAPARHRGGHHGGSNQRARARTAPALHLRAALARDGRHGARRRVA